jgi:hypothetical protein
MLSVNECRKILNQNGKNYTEEEILKIRDWLCKFAEITLKSLGNKTEEEILKLKQSLKVKLKLKKRQK